MAVAVTRIRNFIEREEARLAIASVDRTRWIRLMADVAHGDTEEAALEAHVRAHPEDAERVNWVSWIIYSGVARPGGSVILGDRDPVQGPIAERPADYQSVAAEAAPDELAAAVPVAETKPTASPATEPKKSETEPESNEVVAGFNRRLYYGPSGYWP
jgi:hypothetical protein